MGGATTDVMRSVDKLEKIGKEKLFTSLTEELGLTNRQADEILALVTHEGDPFEILDRFRGKNELFDCGADELADVARHIEGFGLPDSHFKIDLSIARGLDYYTGTVYETVLNDFPEVGSICSGCRYDNLAQYYTTKQLPGVGISIGLTRLFYILQEQGLLSDTLLTAPVDVLIIPMTGEISHSVALATMMRGSGLRVQIFSEDKKFKQKLSYANKLGVPFVVFLGEDEIKADLITVKDMFRGSQTTASAGILTAGIVDKIKSQREAMPINMRS